MLKSREISPELKDSKIKEFIQKLKKKECLMFISSKKKKKAYAVRNNVEQDCLCC